MLWLIGVIEQILTALVPGGEVLAVTYVRPLRWRAEDLNRSSFQTLASDLWGYTVTLLKFSYIYRGLVVLAALWPKQRGNRSDRFHLDGWTVTADGPRNHSFGKKRFSE